MTQPHRLVLTRLAYLLGLTASFAAYAQSGSTPPETVLTPIRVVADPDDPRVPLTSTATKTQTPPRYVPQAIDTVKIDQVQSYGLRTLGDVLTGLPNVSSKQEARFDSVYIRGFEATYDTYLDGVRDDAPYVRDFHAIERVEVLKGPAAVLYGRGSQGGIVNRETVGVFMIKPWDGGARVVALTVRAPRAYKSAWSKYPRAPAAIAPRADPRRD